MKSTVSIRRCPDYDRDRVFEAVHRVLEDLGGIGQFVRQGQNVLLKPNMLSAKEPERGITTHPMVLEAMIEEVRSAGANVWIGDSPSGAIKGVRRFWVNTGYLELAERKDVRLINFEAGGTVIQERNGRKYHMAKSVFEADAMINLPKFKTHGFSLFTGAIKNLYGTLPGFQKSRYHKEYPHPASFSRILVDLYALTKPVLHLTDGILGMEGNGPATGTIRKTGLLLAGSDGVALDAVAAHLMGFKEGEIDAIRMAGLEGLGETRVEAIPILGEPLGSVVFHDFALPSNRLIRMVPSFLVRWLGQYLWIRPQVEKEKCTRCGTCIRNCPVKAIDWVDGYPWMDYKICINCLCCNESCPEGAVVQQRSWVAKRLK